MDCTEESTPHPEVRIYSSTFEGGEVMQQFEADDPMHLQTTGEQRDMLYPVRTEGVYTVPTNPWPRDPEKEERDTTGARKRKPVYRRQGPGNRWDQYGESSSAASKEAHIASEQVSMESNWGPWPPSEPASRDKRPAQPYRLQKANKSDGQWSRWASDIRQSQPDQWSSRSSRWHSSASGERSRNQAAPEWEGSKWSTPTRRTLVGSEYDTDQEWQLRSMRYGDGWAYDSTHGHYKRAKPTQTDPEDDRIADPSLPMGSKSKTYDPRKMAASGRERIVAKSGRIHPHHQVIHLKPALQLIVLEAFMKRKATQ